MSTNKNVEVLRDKSHHSSPAINTSGPSPDAASAAVSPSLGLLLVISGPAGVGKDTVWKAARACLPTFGKAITCTTRPRRPGEEHGVHYYFVNDEEFDSLIHNDQLLEWAHVHNYRYGVPATEILNRLTQGQDVVCVIDVQGACRIRGVFPNALLVFLKPPTEDKGVLKQRIEDRGGVNEAEVALRLKNAEWELSQANIYDYEIVNDQVEHAACQLCEIVEQEKRKRLEDGR